MTPLLSTALLRTQSDARLAALARDGHDRAFEAIVERYRRPLLRYTRRLLPEARAEDVVQQAFLGAWSALRRGEEVLSLRAWLYRITHNALLNAAKERGYEYDELRESLHAPGSPADDLERRIVVRRTLAGVARLPERQRQALLRTAVGGDSQAAVARDLGLSEGAVRQLVHRARAALRAGATALTPLPLVAWAVAASGAAGAGDSGSATRIAELLAGAGSAGGTAALAKGGAVALMAGALVTVPPALQSSRDPGPGAPATTTDTTTRAAGAREPASGGAAEPPAGVVSAGAASRSQRDGRERGKGGDDGAGGGHGHRSRPAREREGGGSGSDGGEHAGGERESRSSPGSGGGDRTVSEEDRPRSGPGRNDEGDGSEQSGAPGPSGGSPGSGDRDAGEDAAHRDTQRTVAPTGPAGGGLGEDETSRRREEHPSDAATEPAGSGGSNGSGDSGDSSDGD